jgi:phosphoethanolamine N-methyltransferase
MPEDAEGPSYNADGVAQLEAIWGEGFMSPGGADEVARIVAGAGIAGADVLEIGSGIGGAAIELAIEHHARSVTGVDVEAYVVERATERAPVGANIRFIVIEPGPLPFADESFDVVFSKDVIIHVADKKALYAEAYRVLRPGGRLCVGDWLRGEGDIFDALVETFITNSGEEFYMQTLADLGSIVASVGFSDIELEDRRDWYLDEAQHELARLRSSLRDHLVERLGQQSYDATVVFWETLVDALQQGAFRPGHVRARKP